MQRVWITVFSLIFVLAALKTGHSESAKIENPQQYNYSADREQIIERFYELSKAGGIIEKPKMPEEFYHNAKIYEIRGDTINARSSYEEYINFNLDFIDPIFDYINILRIQEPPDNIKAIFIKTLENNSNVSLSFALNSLLSRTDKIKALDLFVIQYPEFAAAYLELSKEYSPERIGLQGIQDKQKEKEYLEKYLMAVKSGNLFRYYMDKRVATKALADAETRSNLLNKDHKMRQELGHTFLPDKDLIIQLLPSEEIKELLYSYDNNRYTSNGYIAETKSYPNLNISLKKKIKPYDMYVKYVDIQNNTIGPFKFTVNACEIYSNAMPKKIHLGEYVQFIRRFAIENIIDEDCINGNNISLVVDYKIDYENTIKFVTDQSILGIKYKPSKSNIDYIYAHKLQLMTANSTNNYFSYELIDNISMLDLLFCDKEGCVGPFLYPLKNISQRVESIRAKSKDLIKKSENSTKIYVIAKDKLVGTKTRSAFIKAKAMGVFENNLDVQQKMLPDGIVIPKNSRIELLTNIPQGSFLAWMAEERMLKVLFNKEVLWIPFVNIQVDTTIVK